jgi:hypothetical protein
MKRVLSLCDGIATGKLAFDLMGIKTEYFGIEKEYQARLIADKNIKGIIRPCNNLKDVTPRQILLDWQPFDYFLCGFTCKSLSRQSNGNELDGS